jgi:hypothetical protein
MDRQPELDDFPQTSSARPPYTYLLDAARGVSARALDRLVGLHAHFPADLPSEAIDQLERLGAKALEDRRRGLRLGGGLPVLTIRSCWPEDTTLNGATVPVRDRAPGGLALVLPRPPRVGTVLEVQAPEVDEPFCLQIRHCHREIDGWLAGSEFVGRPPPL